jgi:hypothetical protein
MTFCSEDRMKPIYVAIFLLFACKVMARDVVCDVSAIYRCKNGQIGSTRGRGNNIEIAQEIARSRARYICSHRVDYIRFNARRTNC